MEYLKINVPEFLKNIFLNPLIYAKFVGNF